MLIAYVLQYEPAVTKTIESLLDWMEKYAQSGEAMDLDHYFGYATFDVVGEVVFARPFGFLAKGYDIDNSIANSEMLSAFTAFASFYRHWRNALLTNPIMTWLQILPMGHVFNTTMTAVHEREKNIDNQTNFVIVDHWLHTLKQSPERLTLRNIYAQATNNVGAGADTVNSSLQSFFYHLLRCPAALSKARQEVDDAVKKGLCTSKVVSFADTQQLPYVQACIKEALRFFHPVPMGLPRTAPDGGLTIGDRTFPKGTILSVNPWVIHRSTEIWGPDAREFIPERWFREGAAELERKYFIPVSIFPVHDDIEKWPLTVHSPAKFGAGYASCPGHNIAKMELSKITASILRDYDLQMVDEKREWTWRANFTVVPHKWPILVKRR